MKIFEILLPSTAYSAGNILRKAGYKRLGGGVYGSVYSRPNSPKILKLFGSDDQAYLQYLKLITTISNPHFPIVKGKPRHINNEYYAIQLETLTELPKSYYPLGRACSKYAQTYYKLMGLEHVKFSSKNQKPSPPSIGMARSQLTAFENAYPELSEALRLIVDHVIAPHHHHIDLHPGNFLLRGSTIIISDPATGHHPANELPDELKSPRQLEFPWSKTPPPSNLSASSGSDFDDAISIFDPPQSHETQSLIPSSSNQSMNSTHTWDTHSTPEPITPSHHSTFSQSPNNWWNKTLTPNSEEHNELAHKLFRKPWHLLNGIQKDEIRAALTFQQ